MADNKGTWWIWKVFWILLIVTAAEVVLGIIKPSFFIEFNILGTSLLNVTFLVMTIFKAAYIVMVFMHLGFEVKSFKLTILIPPIILIAYLTFILLTEGSFQLDVFLK